MKANIEFNLPDDRVEYELANNSQKMYSVLWEMNQWLRSNTKYAPDDMSEDTHTAYQKCRDRLHELMNNENISFDY
jgi:DNA-binding HxlR family transcriptional regulator